MTHKIFIMKKLLTLIFASVFFLECLAQCNCAIDYLNCSKNVHPTNLLESIGKKVNCSSVKAKVPTIYYEFNDGTYSINKIDEFFTDDTLNQLKINYRYVGGDKPDVVTSNDDVSKTLNRANASFLREKRQTIDFSNPKDDLFHINDEHVIIILLPQCNSGCAVELDLNSNTNKTVLNGIEIRDYQISNTMKVEGDVFNYRYEGGSEPRLIFVEVKTTDVTKDQLIISTLNVQAVFKNDDADPITSTLPLDVSHAGLGEAKDPNAIEVDQSCLTPEQLNGQQLIYTVHFENEGDADAVNVYVELVFPKGVILSNPNPLSTVNFNGASISIDKISSNTYLYSFKKINLMGIGDPKMPDKEETMASFKLKAKTTSDIRGSQFSTYANIIFEGQNQIDTISPPIEPVRTNDATTSICAKCIYEKPKEETCKDKKAKKYYEKIEDLYNKYRAQLSKTKS